MHEVERRHFFHVLEMAGSNNTFAARVLGFDRRKMYRKLERFDPGGPLRRGVEDEVSCHLDPGRYSSCTWPETLILSPVRRVSAKAFAL
jgi:hypothetical protein